MTRKRALGATGLQVSEIGFGALEIGRDWAPDVNDDPAHCTEGEASHVLNGILDLGINFIDTAPAYWHSEEFIGKAIAHRRGEYVLATKVGEQCDPSGSVYDYSREATLRFIDESLRRLRTDRIDLIQIHSASMDVLKRGETFAAMKEAQQAGKVLHIGMTGGVAESIYALEIGGYETVQFPYNLLNISAEERLLDLAHEKNAGVIIMRGLSGGKLTAKYEKLDNELLKESIREFADLAEHSHREGALAGLALQYILSSSVVSSVIAGTRRLDAVGQNLTAAEQDLPPEIRKKSRALSAALQVSAW